ncbi:MAG: hypothetical protein HYW00_01810 [Candidatus Colwellbacteria bacterium]|nr:hypothetical protein [Candidatus Colwellbacteria bacterium]
MFRTATDDGALLDTHSVSAENISKRGNKLRKKVTKKFRREQCPNPERSEVEFESDWVLL